MKFQIDNGLGIISIRASEIGSYFRCRKPLATVWWDNEGSAGRNLCLLPYDQDYRNEVRNRLLNNLNEDYTDRLGELKELIDPLLMLFPSGKYRLNYYSGRDGLFQYSPYFDDNRKIHYAGWQFAFSEPVNIQDKELKLKEYQQYVAAFEKGKGHLNTLIGYTTGGFYDANDWVFTATQPMSGIDQERVKHFENEISNGARPFAIIFNSNFDLLDPANGLDDAVSYVIDGHHKLLAYQNLNVLPSIVAITYYPKSMDDIEFDVEELIDVLYPWQMEHILTYWTPPDKYLNNPDSTVHRFIKNGHVKIFHENGQPAHEAFYINDKIEEEAKWWYDNGQLQRLEYRKNGVLYGDWKYWYRSGNIQSEFSSNENGTGEGLVVSYFESGKVRQEVRTKNGSPADGYTNLRWYEDGTKESEVEYLNGRTIRIKNYDKSGKLISFQQYDPNTDKFVQKV